MFVRVFCLEKYCYTRNEHAVAYLGLAARVGLAGPTSPVLVILMFAAHILVAQYHCTCIPYVVSERHTLSTTVLLRQTWAAPLEPCCRYARHWE